MPAHCRKTTSRFANEPDPCPDEKVLQALVAGIGPSGLIERHGGHIANCGRCALLLKRYLDTFSDDLTEAEEEILRQLETSKPEGQMRLLQRMLEHMKRTE